MTRAWSLTRSVKRLLPYRDRMNTYFVLESLDTLKKNGRLTGLQAFFATKLNIKPVMGADNGTIIKLDQARGIQKALQRMAEIAVKEAGTTKDKRLVIAHCNAPEPRPVHEGKALLHGRVQRGGHHRYLRGVHRIRQRRRRDLSIIGARKGPGVSVLLALINFIFF